MSDSRATRSLAADRSLTPPVLPVVVVDVVVEALVVGWLAHKAPDHGFALAAQR